MNDVLTSLIIAVFTLNEPDVNSITASSAASWYIQYINPLVRCYRIVLFIQTFDISASNFSPSRRLSLLLLLAQPLDRALAGFLKWSALVQDSATSITLTWSVICAILFRLMLNCLQHWYGYVSSALLAWCNLIQIVKCRTSFASFQSYVESAHSQFPVSLVCACGTKISQIGNFQNYQIVITEFALQNPAGGQADQWVLIYSFAQAANALFMQRVEWPSSNRHSLSWTGRHMLSFTSPS